MARIQTPAAQGSARWPASTGCTTYMGLNTTKKPLNDVRVRQAINYAINKETVVDAARRIEPGGQGHLHPAADGRRPGGLRPAIPTDVEAARKLLAEAGLANGFTFTLDIRANPKMRRRPWPSSRPSRP